MAGASQFWHRSWVSSWPHFVQVKIAAVCPPHLSHLLRYVISPHCAHLRRPTSISMMPPSFWKSRSTLSASTSAVWEDADWNDRRLPPESPSGKRTWGGGFIFLGFDFPGR